MSKFLEWAVVAIPTLIGIYLALFPLTETKTTQRWLILLGCLLFSGMIYWQQSLVRNERSKEFKKLPAAIASEVVKILPKGLNPQPSSWGLTNEQLVLLSQRMKPYAPAVERGDLITAWASDSESIKFAVRLAAAFRTAGWKIPGSGFNQAWFAGAPQGVILRLHSPDDAVPALNEFVQTLRESGIEPAGEIDEKVPSGNFQIVIGAKPQ